MRMVLGFSGDIVPLPASFLCIPVGEGRLHIHSLYTAQNSDIHNKKMRIVSLMVERDFLY